jgi:Skp family chaperone for outer membrane proteins
MKHMNWAQIMGIAACVGVCSATAQIAVVDFERIVKLHPNTAGDRKAIEEVYNTLKGEGDVKAAKVSKAVQAFEEAAKEVQSPVLSEAARKKAESNAKKKYDEAKIESDELKQLEDLHRMQLNERERKLLKRTTDAIRVVVKKIADDKKIKVVLPTAPVLYYDETLDLTADVLRALGVDPAAVDPDAAAAKEVAPAKDALPVKAESTPR